MSEFILSGSKKKEKEKKRKNSVQLIILELLHTIRVVGEIEDMVDIAGMDNGHLTVLHGNHILKLFARVFAPLIISLDDPADVTVLVTIVEEGGIF